MLAFFWFTLLLSLKTPLLPLIDSHGIWFLNNSFNYCDIKTKTYKYLLLKTFLDISFSDNPRAWYTFWIQFSSLFCSSDWLHLFPRTYYFARISPSMQRELVRWGFTIIYSLSPSLNLFLNFRKETLDSLNNFLFQFTFFRKPQKIFPILIVVHLFG